MAMMDGCRELPVRTVFSEFKISIVSSAQAVAGVSQPATRIMRGTLAARARNRRHLSVADARRGRQERNRVSSDFISFSSINNSFPRRARARQRDGGQLEFDFLQTVTVTARRRVRRNAQQ